MTELPQVGKYIGDVPLTAHTRNAIALREARTAIMNFERTYSLSSNDMLLCAEGDSRLSQIDAFELMDWHYALELVKALSSVVGSMHAVDLESHSQSCFQYSRKRSRDLVNSPEPELLLVA